MEHIPRDAAGPTVADLMLDEAETVPSATPVSHARAEFENPRRKLLLVADGDRYLGAVAPETIEGADDAAELGALDLDAVPSLSPKDSAAQALELIETTGATRIPVVDGDGRLRGLVCFNRSRDVFCVDPAS